MIFQELQFENERSTLSNETQAISKSISKSNKKITLKHIYYNKTHATDN